MARRSWPGLRVGKRIKWSLPGQFFRAGRGWRTNRGNGLACGDFSRANKLVSLSGSPIPGSRADNIFSCGVIRELQGKVPQHDPVEGVAQQDERTLDTGIRQ
ncbi:MAG: hypothetical protein ABSF71_10320 [Terriglobia bacterium]